MNEKIRAKAQEFYPIESRANEHTAFLQGYRYGKEWIKLQRDKDGFLIGDVSDLAQFLPFLVLEDMSKLDLPDNVYIVDKDSFGEWCGDIDTRPRYSHILPNVPIIERI